jgi:hypothetical protein
MSKQVRIRGVRRSEIDEDKLSLALWLMSTRLIKERRARAAALVPAAELKARKGEAEHDR